MIADIHAHMHLIPPQVLEEVPAYIISSCTERGELTAVLSMADSFPQIRISAALHPQIAWTENPYTDFLEQAAPWLTAIGETGLDFYPANPPPKQQIAVFSRHISIANRCGKPLIIHCRNAFDQIFDILEKENNTVPVLFHGYSGGFKYLDKIVKKGYHISFGTSLTWPQSAKLRRIASEMPQELIAAETDSPYGAFWRDHSLSNIPVRITEVIEAIGRLRQNDRMEAQIWENTVRIFNFKQGETNRWKENLRQLLTDFPF